jgi:sugar phosphate isomerase/epimerase
MHQQSRRDVLKALAAAPMAASVAATASAQSAPRASSVAALPKTTLCLVSRHLQWTDVQEGAAAAVEGGCTAVAWSVRGGAHIVPTNVERELPRAVEAARKAGLETPMVITAIVDAQSERVEAILDTMRGLGIRYYRAPSFRYDYTAELMPQLEALKPRIASLAKLNEQYGTTAMYHTHSGAGNVGGGVWDLWLVLKEFDPQLVGLNYDLGHATIRGGTGWVDTSHFAHRHVRGLSLKDFRWVKGSGSSGGGGRRGTGEWAAEMVPGGEGMVDFKGMLGYFKSAGFVGPVELYQEYSVTVPGRTEPVNMLGTNYGTWKLEMPRAEWISLLKRDVAFYSNALRDAGLIQ